jgi:hypothetical protein
VTVPVAAHDLLTALGLPGWLRLQLATAVTARGAPTRPGQDDGVRHAVALARLAEAAVAAWTQQKQAQAEWPLELWTPLAEMLVATLGTCAHTPQRGMADKGDAGGRSDAADAGAGATEGCVARAAAGEGGVAVAQLARTGVTLLARLVGGAGVGWFATVRESTIRRLPPVAVLRRWLAAVDALAATQTGPAAHRCRHALVAVVCAWPLRPATATRDDVAALADWLAGAVAQGPPRLAAPAIGWLVRVAADGMLLPPSAAPRLPLLAWAVTLAHLQPMTEVDPWMALGLAYIAALAVSSSAAGSVGATIILPALLDALAPWLPAPEVVAFRLVMAGAAPEGGRSDGGEAAVDVLAARAVAAAALPMLTGTPSTEYGALLAAARTHQDGPPARSVHAALAALAPAHLALLGDAGAGAPGRAHASPTVHV